MLQRIHILRHYVDAGGLMSYGVDFVPMMRRAASFVAKILRGVKPADLPLEQVVVNLKTAKAMGVTLPTSILLRAATLGPCPLYPQDSEAVCLSAKSRFRKS